MFIREETGENLFKDIVFFLIFSSFFLADKGILSHNDKTESFLTM